VRFAVPNSSWYVEPENKFVPRNPTLDIGHALAGPIAVRGASVGQTLVVRIDEVRPASWGVT
jgi:acetamidase/formamidase